jgi:hypothetical protein
MLIKIEMKTTPGKKSDQTVEGQDSDFGINPKYECLQNQKIRNGRSYTAAIVESINRYYNHLSNSRIGISEKVLNSCFAVRLARFLTEVISSNKFSLTRSGCFKQDFYNLCLARASEHLLTQEMHDTELLIIYMKQCLLLLRLCGILMNDGGYAKICEQEISGSSLYFRLFRAFWDQADWEVLFPSDADSARELKKSKNILKDLVLNHHGSTRLDSVINEFFDMTGFSRGNDLVMISFLDFYFFTWLNHFSMIMYAHAPVHAPVCISVTEAGRKILNSVI